MSVSRRLGASLATLIVFAMAGAVHARQGEAPFSRQKAAQPLSSISVKAMPAVDVTARLAEDRMALAPGPIRFAVPHEVNVTPSTHGTWEQLADGGRLWRLRVFSPGATDLNFGFTRYRLPSGATLHVLSEQEGYFEGPYTEEDNKPHGQLWTPVVPGQRAVIELYVPAEATAEPELLLSRIGLGYRDLFGRHGADNAKAGSCNIDVACPVGDPWRDEIRSVGGYSFDGTIFCTGTLIMDVPGSFRPFFLTANHCGVDDFNASSVVVYWNFESPSCGWLCCGSLADNQTGATFRASDYDIDFALLELDADPDPGFNVCYSGWDRSGAVPLCSVSIHHPSGDEKAISINDDPLTISGDCTWSCVHNKCEVGEALDPWCDPCVDAICLDDDYCCDWLLGEWDSVCVGYIPSMCGPLCDTHWIVDDWESGTTEAGSSGAGLWDCDTHKLVGVLSGGEASCANPGGLDCFGRFSVAWSRRASASQRLSNWLDPGGTGTIAVSGSCPSTPTPCDDGSDNDGDGLTDYPDDPGCADAGDVSEKDESGTYLCDDGINNDPARDDLIDYPADPGCYSPFSRNENPQCQNGHDDDNDDLIDFDGGQSIWGQCTGAPGGCPTEVSDPDGNGVANPDPKCGGKPWDNNERCGLGAELALLLPPLLWLYRRRGRRG
jgi:hypothetical protein